LKAAVIIPVRDESSSVKPLCEAFARLMERNYSVSEVIFVDDHSCDSTSAQIKACSRNFPFVTLLSLNNERGKGAAIRMGFEKSRCDILVTMDGDQQYSPLDIPAVLQPILDGSADLVVGKGSNHSSIVRRVSSRLFQLIFTSIFWLPLSAPNEGLKAILKVKFDELDVTANGFDFDIEILVKAKRRLFRIKEIEVERHERTTGKSKVHVLPTAARMCARMARLWLFQRK
jgi:glycosyltransferase involved in cell wall biosynthesis